MATINSKEQEFSQKISEHRELLNAHVVEMVNWHFSPETGCPFGLTGSAMLIGIPRWK